MTGVLKLHQPIDLVAEGRRIPGVPDSVICLECSDPHGWPEPAWSKPWPCPTVQVIDHARGQ